MDKILKYRQAVMQFLQEYQRIIPHGWTHVANQLVADKENDHYQLVRTGWHEGKRIHYIVFHFDIVNGKVLVQVNRTDLPITEELGDLGISEEDIIIAFWKSDAMNSGMAVA